MIDQDKVAIDNEISKIQAISQMGEQESTIAQDIVDWWAKELAEQGVSIENDNPWSQLSEALYYPGASDKGVIVDSRVINRYAEYRGWKQKGHDNFQIVQTEESM